MFLLVKTYPDIKIERGEIVTIDASESVMKQITDILLEKQNYLDDIKKRSIELAEKISQDLYEYLQEHGIESQTHYWDTFGQSYTVEAYFYLGKDLTCISTSIYNIDEEESNMFKREWRVENKLAPGQFGLLYYIFYLKKKYKPHWSDSKDLSTIVNGIQKWKSTSSI